MLYRQKRPVWPLFVPVNGSCDPRISEPAWKENLGSLRQTGSAVQIGADMAQSGLFGGYGRRAGMGMMEMGDDDGGEGKKMERRGGEGWMVERAEVHGTKRCLLRAEPFPIFPFAGPDSSYWYYRYCFFFARAILSRSSPCPYWYYRDSSVYLTIPCDAELEIIWP